MHTSSHDSVREHCPICGEPNDCQMAGHEPYKGPCWCEKESFPQELLARVPEELRRQSCICRKCLLKAKRSDAKSKSAPYVKAGDFYIENDYIVFTSQYLLKRGYCCGNGCRHCPYDGIEKNIAEEEKDT